MLASRRMPGDSARDYVGLRSEMSELGVPFESTVRFPSFPPRNLARRRASDKTSGFGRSSVVMDKSEVRELIENAGIEDSLFSIDAAQIEDGELSSRWSSAQRAVAQLWSTLGMIDGMDHIARFLGQLSLEM